MNVKSVFVVLAVAWATGCSAELKLAALFSDGMVLQRQQPVPVWGWTDPGKEVTVSIAGQEQRATADRDGKFMVRLKGMEASSQPRILLVKCGAESAEVKDVLVGEVWLCAGQSNMQMGVNGAGQFDKEKPAANHPLIRMFFVGMTANKEVQRDCIGRWEVCSPETVGAFSATAYFFGRELHKELDVPVGLIRSAWGGTRIEAWSPLASLDRFPAAQQLKQEQDALAATFNEAASEANNAKMMAAWSNRVEQAKAGGQKWPEKPKLKVHPHKASNYPANLYNAMIHPLVPYGIRGAIWYQGENNAYQAPLYFGLLENMVSEWRRDWGSEFPFYAVQLPNFKIPQTQPVEDSDWALMREAFLQFHRKVPNAGMAVTIDAGMEKNIHPTNKQTVGRRLARQALAKTYGKAVVPGGPVYRSMHKEDGKIVVRFDDIGAGLMARGGEPLKRFAIAGEDRRFAVAQATIVGDAVEVSSPEVPDPVAVRYAWASNPTGCNLCNKDGLPASPFRTDDWPPAEK